MSIEKRKYNTPQCRTNMPISNYTTKIDSMKTISEIQSMLMMHGAEKIMVESRDKMPVSLTFMMVTAKGIISFRLPANYSGVLRVLLQDPKVPKAQRNEEQALRVAWRIIRDWTEAQLAIIEAELASIEQVFLPYAITKAGNTVFEDFSSGNLLIN